MPPINPNLSPGANRRLGATFRGDEDEVPSGSRTFAGFSRFASENVRRPFKPNPARTPAANAQAEREFESGTLLDKIRFVYPGLDERTVGDIVTLHGRVSRLAAQGSNPLAVAPSLLRAIEGGQLKFGAEDQGRFNARKDAVGDFAGSTSQASFPNRREGSLVGADFVGSAPLTRSRVGALVGLVAKRRNPDTFGGRR